MIWTQALENALLLNLPKTNLCFENNTNLNYIKEVQFEWTIQRCIN